MAPPQVSFLDIARNPLLARAARAELHAGNPEAAAASASAAAGVPLPEAEVAPLPAVHVFAQASMTPYVPGMSNLMASLHAHLGFQSLGGTASRLVMVTETLPTCDPRVKSC